MLHIQSLRALSRGLPAPQSIAPARAAGERVLGVPGQAQAQAAGVPLPITRDGNNLQLANPPVPQSVAAGLLAGLVINFAACTCRKHPVSVQSLCEYGTFVARSGPAQKVRSGGIRSCVLDVEMITAVHYVQCSGLRLSR